MQKTAVRVTLADVAARLEADLDVFVDDIEQRVLERIRSARLDCSAAVQDAVRRAVVVGVRDWLALLRSEADTANDLPPDIVGMARLQAVRRCEVVGLAEVWLEGQEGFWDCFEVMTERILDDTVLCWEVVKAARVRLSGRTARVHQLFRLAREETFAADSRRVESVQWEAVSRVLRGCWIDADELGYNLANSHIAVVADTSSLLHALAHHTGRELLQVQAPGGGVWGWLGGESRLSDAGFDELLAWQRAQEGDVAFGDPSNGIGGFAESHYQALEARSIAGATGDRVVRFADLRLLIAVLRDSQLAKSFVERELGELDRPGERMNELRATLRVYLERGQSVSTTAALRHRDRKTIQRQLRTVERLIHHYVHDRSDELLIALRAAEILRRRLRVQHSLSGRTRG